MKKLHGAAAASHAKKTGGHTSKHAATQVHVHVHTSKAPASTSRKKK